MRRRRLVTPPLADPLRGGVAGGGPRALILVCVDIVELDLSSRASQHGLVIRCPHPDPSPQGHVASFSSVYARIESKSSPRRNFGICRRLSAKDYNPKSPPPRALPARARGAK